VLGRGSHCALLAVWATLCCPAGAADRGAQTEGLAPWYYFGDVIERPDSYEVRTSVRRGFELFVQVWGDAERHTNKAPSCVSCHEAPMPGGSGITAGTRVTAIPSDLTLTGFKVVGRGDLRDGRSDAILLRTPPLFGLGILEIIRCNVTDSHACAASELGYRGRMRSIEDFVTFAFQEELGVQVVGARPTDDKGSITLAEIKDVALYIRSLAPPPQFSPDDPARVARGRELFDAIGCSSCHIPVAAVTVPAQWKDVRWAAYSDHRMYNIRSTSKYKVRTAPLWGLSYVGPPYMHDATAESIEDAIKLHARDAEKSRNWYGSLPTEDRLDLLHFLRSL
jgi:CxxC motif-containing protein (DUF1111 family)